MALKYLTSLILATGLFVSTASHAKEQIWLTTANRHGDCISSQITTPKSTFELSIMDKSYCTKNNTEDTSKITTCLENLKQQKTVRSFIDYCGDGITYIGINGGTYPLTRISPLPKQHPYLVGLYEGKTVLGKPLSVEVKPIRLIKKTYQDNTSTKDDNIMDYQMRVIITVKEGKMTRKLIGLLDESI
jgi:hypothetical protein